MHREPLPLRACAVLGIDLQNEFRDPGPYPVEDYDRILAHAAAIVVAAREAGVPVIHVQAWVESDERHRYPLLDESETEALRSAVAGSAGAEICAEIAPVEGETVIRKAWPSAFLDTGLDEHLRRIGARHIVVMGVWTESCVRASVLDATFRGYRVWLVKDACGSGTRTMHRSGVLDIANRLYGGGILRASETVKALRGEPYAAWRCSRPIEFAYRLETLDGLYETL